MDKIRVEMKSRETIEPSSPTPQNLKIFNLSLLDQIAPPLYVPWIFYYASNDKANIKIQEQINRLKESLSQALTRFYPLAGKVRDNLFIESNDDGADFSEAEVNCSLGEILTQHETDVLDQLLPRDYHCNNSSLGVQLAVQVNTFSCGGMAIGICVSHKLVDGATLSSFVNMWAAIARGSGDSLSFTFPGQHLFPQRDLSGLVPRFSIPTAKCISKRFVFPGSKIASLKEKVKSSNGDIVCPTRIEVVSALIWRCATEASRTKSGDSSPSLMTHAVNLRPRMDPTLPDCAAGNLSWLAIAQAPTQRPAELRDFVSPIRDAIKKVNKDYTTHMQGENGVSFMTEFLEQIGDLVPENVELYRFISWARFRLYEANFGWGKPIWVSTAGMPFKNAIIFIDTREGCGLEAWVTMEEEDMTIFEQSQELRLFVSSKGNV